jgi:hypothetical protein
MVHVCLQSALLKSHAALFLHRIHLSGHGAFKSPQSSSNAGVSQTELLTLAQFARRILGETIKITSDKQENKRRYPEIFEKSVRDDLRISDPSVKDSAKL